MQHPVRESSGQSHPKIERVVSKGSELPVIKGKKEERKTFPYLPGATKFHPSPPLTKHWGVGAEAG